jgi:hypothetical protein
MFGREWIECWPMEYIPERKNKAVVITGSIRK